MISRILCCILSVVLCLLACACQASQEANKDCYITFVDDLGREVTLSEKPSRVAVLFSSYAEIWTVAGGEVAITVGESVSRELVAPNTPLVDVNAGKSIDCERLLAYTPDFVIASADIDAQVACSATLQAAGIPTAYFRVDSFSDYLNMLEICTRITQVHDAYEAYGCQIDAQIKQTIASTEGKNAPKILFIRAGGQVVKAKTSNDNFVCDMLAQLGAENIADKAPILLDDLSIEMILYEDPDFIFISTMGDESAAIENIEALFSNPTWSTLRAVREKNYCFLPKDRFQYKPNQRWGDAYAYLKEILYDGEA